MAVQVPSINQLKQTPFPVTINQDPWAPTTTNSSNQVSFDFSFCCLRFSHSLKKHKNDCERNVCRAICRVYLLKFDSTHERKILDFR